MNQAQRNFLIKKIEDRAKELIDALKQSLPKKPEASNYLLHAVLSGTFQIKTNDEIKEAIRQKAVRGASSSRNEWMSDPWGRVTPNEISLKVSDIFILPEEYTKQRDEYEAKENEVYEQIQTIKIQTETLIIRIQLASDKTLQTMINEVDNMGNLSLIDTKLKALTA